MRHPSSSLKLSAQYSGIHEAKKRKCANGHGPGKKLLKKHHRRFTAPPDIDETRKISNEQLQQLLSGEDDVARAAQHDSGSISQGAVDTSEGTRDRPALKLYLRNGRTYATPKQDPMCTHCKKRSADLYPCRTCKRNYFCSKTCEEKSAQWHALTCKPVEEQETAQSMWQAVFDSTAQMDGAGAASPPYEPSEDGSGEEAVRRSTSELSLFQDPRNYLWDDEDMPDAISPRSGAPELPIANARSPDVPMTDAQSTAQEDTPLTPKNSEATLVERSNAWKRNPRKSRDDPQDRFYQEFEGERRLFYAGPEPNLKEKATWNQYVTSAAANPINTTWVSPDMAQFGFDVSEEEMREQVMLLEAANQGKRIRDMGDGRSAGKAAEDFEELQRRHFSRPNRTAAENARWETYAASYHQIHDLVDDTRKDDDMDLDEREGEAHNGKVEDTMGTEEMGAYEAMKGIRDPAMSRRLTPRPIIEFTATEGR